MKTVFSVASLLACAFSLDAQISATLIHASNGLDDVKIRNNSKISLMAYVVAAKRVPQSANASSAPFVRYYDPLIEPVAKPLLPGEVFADDSTTGDPALLAGLVLRRSNMLLAVDTTLETLSEPAGATYGVTN